MEQITETFTASLGKMTVYIIIAMFVAAVLGLAIKIAEKKITNWALKKKKEIEGKKDDAKLK